MGEGTTGGRETIGEQEATLVARSEAMCLVPEPVYPPALDLRPPPLPTPELRPEVAGRRRGKITEGGHKEGDHLRLAAALQEEGEGSSGHICLCDARGMGVERHGFAEERCGRSAEMS